MLNTTAIKLFHSYKVLIVIANLLLGCQCSWAQTEYATIDLDASMGKITEIQQFSNGQGKLMFLFNKKDKKHQYSIVNPDKSILTKLLWPKLPEVSTDAIHDDKEYILFYRSPGRRSIYVYRPEDPLATSVPLEVKTYTRKELHLLDFFHSGNLYVCNYTISPFSLHTYQYKQGDEFLKLDQVFDDSKREKFWGIILMEDEFIIIRYSRKKTQMVLYRFFPDYGFARKTFDLKALFKESGINEQSVSSLDFVSENNSINAFIKDQNIYLNTDQLLRTFRFRSTYKKPFPGVIKLNWETQESQLLELDRLEFEHYRNRAVTIQNELYFKFLVNKKLLELSIFDLAEEKLLKHYTYEAEKVVNLVYERANMEKLHTIYLGIISISFRLNKDIDGKKLLKNLTRGNLYLDVFSDQDFYELSISSILDNGSLMSTNFSSYLSKSDLKLIYNFDKQEDTRYQQMDTYLNQIKSKGNLGEYLVYPFGDHIHLAYIHTKLKQCKIIAF